MVNLVGRFLEELAARIVGDRDQIDDVIDALEMGGLEFAAVGVDQFDLRVFCQQITTEKEAIQCAHAIALMEQHRHERGANVAAGTGDEDTLHT